MTATKEPTDLEDISDTVQKLSILFNKSFENDIKEIYDRIVVLEAKGNALSKNDKQELEHQLAALFDWAKQVSKKTGIGLPKL